MSLQYNLKAKPIKAKIMAFIALDNQPFSVVCVMSFADWLSNGTQPSALFFRCCPTGGTQ
jgi:hypothetical protein